MEEGRKGERYKAKGAKGERDPLLLFPVSRLLIPWPKMEVQFS
jgi:hypothetical protein